MLPRRIGTARTWALFIALAGVAAAGGLAAVAPMVAVGVVGTIAGFYASYRWPHYVAILIVALVPLDVLAMISRDSVMVPITVAKLAFPPLALATAWRIAVQGERLYWPREATYATLVAIGFCLSALFMVEKKVGLVHLRHYLSMIGLFLILLQVMRERRHIGLLLGATAATTFVSCLVGLLLYVRAGAGWGAAATGAKFSPLQVGQPWSHRMTGMTLGDANSFAAMAAVVAAIAIVGALHVRRIWLKALLFATLPVFLLSISHAYSRGSLIGLILGALLAGMLYRRRIPLPLTLGAVTVVLVCLIPLAPAQYLERLGRLNSAGLVTDFALRRRFSYHVLGLQLFQRAPLLGLGPGNFGHYYCMEEFRFIVNSFGERRDMHNVVLEVLMDGGLLTLLPFLLLIGSMFWRFVRSRRECDMAGTDSALPNALLVGSFVLFTCQLFMPGASQSKFLWAFLAMGPTVNAAVHRELERKDAVAFESGPLVLSDGTPIGSGAGSDGLQG